MKKRLFHAGIARLALILFLAAFLPATVLAAQPTYAVSITSQTVTGYHLDIAGNASGTPYAGQFSQHNVYVSWGDGAESNTSTINFTDDGKNFTGTWSNDHDYSGSGTYSMTVKLYHGNVSGKDASADSIVIIPVVVPPSANLTVVKHVINDGVGTKTAGDFTINVTGTGVSTPTFAGSETGTTVTLTPGTYGVDEADAFGYTKTLGTDCSGTIADGETKTCTITNDDPAVVTPSATLVVTKHVVNDDAGDNVAGDFTMNVTGTGVSNPSFTGAESGTTVTLTPGTYGVDEADSLGYTKTLGTDCSGTIANGETKYCTITNDDPEPESATLTVIKHVINDDAGDNIASDFTMNVTGTGVSTPSFSGDETGTTVTLTPGSYSVDEADSLGYTKTLSTDCSGTIANGETKTCTITNDDLYVPPGSASLTVTKHVVNDDGGDAVAGDFTINVTGAEAPTLVTVARVTRVVTIAEVVPEPSSSYSFPGAESGTTVILNPGDYSVDEDAFTGYAKTLGEGCSGTIKAGDNLTCTITNDDISPKLTVTKVVINEYEGTAEVSDFPLFVDETPVASGITNEFPVGDYEVSETNMTGYTAAFSGACDSEGMVSLALGDEKTCTITNSDSPAVNKKATLMVIKHVINNNGGAWVAANFTMTVNGTSVSSTSFAGSETGTTITLDAGTYSVDEVAATGYTKILGAGCSGTISAGQTVSCTVTNDDIATNNGSSGSSGGGGGGSGGFYRPRTTTTPTVTEPEPTPEPEPTVTDDGEVLGETSCGMYLNEYIHVRKKNNPDEVYKLQLFLNENLGLGLTVNGDYNSDTVRAVNKFQLKYADDILKPWHLKAPTGYVYITTRRKINLLKCPDLKIDIPSPLVRDKDITDNT
jgi:hypothetical protein